jgi:hypothetical protein
MTLPYPHARNDCEVCRERDADFKAAMAGAGTCLICQNCLGPFSVTQVHLMSGRAAVTLEWAPLRLADHGLTAEG